MLNESEARYDAENPTQTIIGADDPQPPAAIQTQTAAQLAKLSSETMDPAPVTKKGKGKPAAEKAKPGKAEEPGLPSLAEIQLQQQQQGQRRGRQ